MRQNRDKIAEACRNSWIASGKGRWLVAVSGGADSVALLTGCIRAGIPVEVAHCNFNLRGQESLRDRDFVDELCRKADIRLHLREFDTAREAAEGESLELTCRRIRYDFFFSLLEYHDFSRIAVAHNAGDNRETLLLNLLRGSGSQGLKAMLADSGKIIRPLLSIEREEIIEYLGRKKQDYIVDSTNLESEFRRNFIRNEVLPLLHLRWDGVNKALDRSIDIFQREAVILNHYIEKALGDNSRELPMENIKSFPDSETLIFHFIKPHGGSPEIAKEITRSLQAGAIGKRWIFDNNRQLTITKYSLIIEDISGNPDGEQPIEATDKSDFQWILLSEKEGRKALSGSSTLDIAYTPRGPENYIWKNADKNMLISPLGMSGRQKVWKILKDGGVTLVARPGVKVLVAKDSREVIWIPGFKRSRYDIVTPESKIIYEIRPQKEEC